MGLRLIPNISIPRITLSSVWSLFGAMLANSVAYWEWNITSKWLKILSAIKNSPKNSNIWLLAIFAEVSENEFVRERHPLSKAIIWSILRSILANGVGQYYSLIFDCYQNQWSWMTLNGVIIAARTTSVPSELLVFCRVIFNVFNVV